MKILSGGQTGVDRAALDAALELGVETGGWCPKGRRAEDGEIPLRYNLAETESDSYSERTRRNVADTDGTLVFYDVEPTGGTLLTVEIASYLKKPLRLVSPQSDHKNVHVEAVMQWISRNRIEELNVAGPRHSEADLYGSVFEIMKALLIVWRDNKDHPDERS